MTTYRKLITGITAETKGKLVTLVEKQTDEDGEEEWVVLAVLTRSDLEYLLSDLDREAAQQESETPGPL